MNILEITCTVEEYTRASERLLAAAQATIDCPEGEEDFWELQRACDALRAAKLRLEGKFTSTGVIPTTHATAKEYAGKQFPTAFVDTETTALIDTTAEPAPFGPDDFGGQDFYP